MTVYIKIITESIKKCNEMSKYKNTQKNLNYMSFICRLQTFKIVRYILCICH